MYRSYENKDIFKETFSSLFSFTSWSLHGIQHSIKRECLMSPLKKITWIIFNTWDDNLGWNQSRLRWPWTERNWTWMEMLEKERMGRNDLAEGFKKVRSQDVSSPCIGCKGGFYWKIDILTILHYDCSVRKITK